MAISKAPSKGWIGRIEDGNLDSYIITYFQFNPTEDVHSIAPQYTMVEPAGSPAPTAVFKSLGGDTVQLRLLLDATESWDQAQEGIRAQRAFLESLARPDLSRFLDSPGQFVSPPLAVIGIGVDVWKGIVTSYECQVTKRSRKLVPIRAFVSLTLKTIHMGQDQTQFQYQQLLDDRKRLGRY